MSLYCPANSYLYFLVFYSALKTVEWRSRPKHLHSSFLFLIYTCLVSFTIFFCFVQPLPFIKLQVISSILNNITFLHLKTKVHAIFFKTIKKNCNHRDFQEFNKKKNIPLEQSRWEIVFFFSPLLRGTDIIVFQAKLTS